MNNLWLPPTTSVIVELSKGEHTVEVQGVKEDSPILYWRQVTDETVFRSPVAHSLDYTVFSGNADEIIARAPRQLQQSAYVAALGIRLYSLPGTL